MAISVFFLLASLGVVNGTLLGLFMLFKKKRQLQELFFAGLLLSLCIRIGKSVFYYFNRDADLLILQVGLSACVFIGPFFYLFVQSLSRNQKQVSNFSKYLLPGLLLAIILVGLVFPYRTSPEMWNGYIVYGIYLVWLLFALLGCVNAWKLLSAGKLKKGDRQLFIGIVVGFLFITTTYQLALFIGITYIWGSLIFSFTFYWLSLRFILGKKSFFPKPTEAPTGDTSMVGKVDQLMQIEKPFLQQGFKLEDLADLSDIPKHTLSRLLNEAHPGGFAHYVQQFRVAEARSLIEHQTHLSLEGIGYEAGFKSKSAFFEAFRKITNTTPAAYRKSLSDEAEASK